ncbi:MAG TPA: CotH kinase family protein [Saprospiraceae bacterium]|nr:CotH kinase family protein [Saprospiraceae bacterium]HMP23309.1 CotH kinase family protein [Saprospiraceae bacterium]
MRIYTFLLIMTSALASATAQELYHINTIAEIKIHFQEANWDTILDSLKRNQPDERLTGDATINGKKYTGVGVRYKGNSSFNSTSREGEAKLPFNIKIDYTNKEQLLPGGYGTLKLANAFRDPSMVREVLSYEIARKYMPASRANFTKVYVNERYLGLYQSIESVDNRFLTEHFGNSDGVLVKCDPEWSVEQAPDCPDSDQSSLMYIGKDSLCYMRFYELKDQYGWQNLIRLMRTLNQQPERIEALLNVNQTLWMLAFNNVLVNLDSYTGMLSHNYYLYEDTAGVYHPIIWDLNMSFGGFRRLSAGGQLSLEDMQTLSPFVHYKDNNLRRPLITKLLANDLYRKIYLAHIRTLLDENFTNGDYLKRAKALQALIDKEVQQDPHKLYSYEAFHQNLSATADANGQPIVGIAELMEKRAEYLLSHPVFQKGAPVVSAVQHKVDGTQLLVTADVTDTQQCWLFYRNNVGGHFAPVKMYDNGSNGDAVAADGRWSVQLPYQKDAHYYIVAEGERVARLSPNRAAQEFYRVNNSTAAAGRKAK